MAEKTCKHCGAGFSGDAAAELHATHVADFHPGKPSEDRSAAATTGETEGPAATAKRAAPPGAEARAALVARAVELGIPAKGKSADLQKAIDAEEKKRASG